MKLKKQDPEKQKRKSDIAYMALVATMVNNIISGDGVCGVHPYLERRKTVLQYKPGVQLQPWKFMELFGDDTEFEYLEDRDGDKTLYVEVNGVSFYAPVNGMDEIIEGRLV